MNRTLLRCCVPVLCAGVIPILAAAGQTPPQPAPGSAPPGVRAPYVPKNLKVLPDNTDLRKVMRDYAGALGVECEFCHTPADPATHREDRASDANPMKDVARYMIRMTDDLNDKYMAQLPKAPNVDADSKVACGTCHRGHSKPEAFVPPPRQQGPRPPGAGAAPGQGPAPAPPPGN